MNKHDEAMLAYALKHHPGLLGRMQTVLSMGDGMGGFAILLRIAFEAGQQFAADHPGKLNDSQASSKVLIARSG